MSSEIDLMVIELKSLENRMDQDAETLEELTSKRDSMEIGSRESKKKYFDFRALLVKTKLQEEHLNWCTLCMKVFPEQEMTLVLTEGREQIESGYSSVNISFSVLYRACPQCLNEQLAHNGFQAETHGCSVQHVHINGRDVESFSASQVGTTDGGVHYVYKSGKMLEKLILPDLSPENLHVNGVYYDTKSLIDKLYKRFFPTPQVATV